MWCSLVTFINSHGFEDKYAVDSTRSNCCGVDVVRQPMNRVLQRVCAVCGFDEVSLAESLQVISFDRCDTINTLNYIV